MGLAYFREIETLFVELRGSPLLLSPADWQVAREWQDEGIPLEVVEAALIELFAERAAVGKKKISSLRYCSPAVRRRWQERRELSAGALPAAPQPLDVGERLAVLAGRLPAELPHRAHLAAEILSLAKGGEPTDLEAIEARLAGLDAALLDSLEDQLPEEVRKALEVDLDRAVSALSSKLPVAEAERRRTEHRRSLVRRRTGAPVLSLFDD